MHSKQQVGVIDFSLVSIIPRLPEKKQLAINIILMSYTGDRLRYQQTACNMRTTLGTSSQGILGV
jgi:hypothetical protein